MQGWANISKKNMFLHNQLEFVPGMQRWLNFRKPINVKNYVRFPNKYSKMKKNRSIKIEKELSLFKNMVIYIENRIFCNRIVDNPGMSTDAFS